MIEGKEYWANRAKKYDNLEWVKDKEYLGDIVNSVNFEKEDVVLDFGGGTGAVSDSLCPLVDKVFCVDISQEMLNKNKPIDNKYLISWDLSNKQLFDDCIFDKIVARMAFHHITYNTQKSMDQCYKMLKHGGKMIVSEGVPPHDDLVKDYAEIFALKEDRITFTQKDLFDLMDKSGFKNIKYTKHVIEDFSLNNWLDNNVDEITKNKIFELHCKGSNFFKEQYNLREVKDDILIKVTQLIMVGEK